MVDERFIGKWRMETMENFDEYMKVLEVGLVLRKAGSVSTTTYEISKDGDTWTWKYKIAFKSGTVHWRLDEEFDEVTPDGRKVKSTISWDDGMLVQVQRGKPCETTLTRSIRDDDTMLEILKAKDVVCTKTYKRVE